MAEKQLMGKITFINHEKDYVTIEYEAGGKTRTINGNISEKEQQKLKEAKIIKKIHRFHVGDEVSFVIALSPRGDKMIADCIQFHYNNALDNLINKSEIENRFVGYLKKTDDGYFVKETGSYIFFKLKLSPWEKTPHDEKLNEPVFFSLHNTDKPDKAYATFFKSVFIPEYIKALDYCKKKTVIDATVFKITPHGVFVHVISDKIQAKIPVQKTEGALSDTKVGDMLKVVITYLGSDKIVVETA